MKFVILPYVPSPFRGFACAYCIPWLPALASCSAKDQNLTAPIIPLEPHTGLHTTVRSFCLSAHAFQKEHVLFKTEFFFYHESRRTKLAAFPACRVRTVGVIILVMALNSPGARWYPTLQTMALILPVAPPQPDQHLGPGGKGYPITFGAGTSSCGLEAERRKLLRPGLPLGSGYSPRCPALSFRAYKVRLQPISDWSSERGFNLIQDTGPIQDVLGFLQGLLEKGKVGVALGVFVAVIITGYMGFGNLVPSVTLVNRFLQSGCRLRPPSWQTALSLDL